MNIDEVITEKVKRFEDVKNQIAEIGKKIGGLTEQQRALYNQGLEFKGAIEALLAMKEADAKALAASKTAQLTLPVGVIPEAPQPTTEGSAPVVDGSVVETASENKAVPASELPARQPVTLEVK